MVITAPIFQFIDVAQRQPGFTVQRPNSENIRFSLRQLM